MSDLLLSGSLTIDELPSNELKWLAKEIGLDAVIKIIINFSGINIYIPIGAKTALKKGYVKKHYDGTNTRELALKLNVSERTVQSWISEVPKNIKQLNLF